MRSWSATWPNIAPTWLENPPKMEAREGVRAQVFQSFFFLEGLLAPRRPKRGPRGPKRAPRLNFDRIFDGFWNGLGNILEEFWDGFGKTFLLDLHHVPFCSSLDALMYRYIDVLRKQSSRYQNANDVNDVTKCQNSNVLMYH